MDAGCVFATGDLRPWVDIGAGCLTSVILALMKSPSASEPTILWHYTDAGGLHGMITEQQLRCGNVHFLNDQTEHFYGWGMVRRQLRSFRCNDVACSFIAREALGLVSDGESRVIPHAISFSELPDAMSQWQRYGNDGAGYAIGFDVAGLREICSSILPVGRLERLVYEPRRQRDLVARPIAAWHAAMPNHQFRGTVSAVERLGNELRASTPSQQIDANEVAVALAINLSRLAMTLKHRDFKDEQEWRLITLSTRDQIPGAPPIAPPEFYVSRNVVKPFAHVSMMMASGQTRPLPIVEVRCGPRLPTRLAKNSVRTFLDTFGYHQTRVSVSRLVRTWR